MSFQVFFGDDEHTAVDGPYKRALKTRKWLYVATSAAILLEQGLYHPAALEASIKLVSLPQSLLRFSVSYGLGYLILQYTLLLFQLKQAYRVELTDRFVFRRADELRRLHLDAHKASANAKALQARRRSLSPELAAKGKEALDEEIEAEVRRYEALSQGYSALEQLDPAEHPAYRWAEVAIDLLRLAPPLVVALAAFAAICRK